MTNGSPPFLIGHLLVARSMAPRSRAGQSWLRDALGQQVLPEGLSLIEDPHRPRVSGSRPFDAEGLPTQTREIVDDGVLTGWTLDLATGAQAGLHRPPGTQRAAPHQPPIATSMECGADARHCDARRLDPRHGHGLLVTSMIGSTINPNTGDYSRGASGFWVENGQIAYAGQRMHHRGKPARHAAADHPCE